MKKAKFITLEGVDGAGKSTHIDFIKSYFELKSLEYIVTREPGGTDTGEKIREILLNDEMSPITESLLMFAARYEHLSLVIHPNLRSGVTVISDRFTDSSYAYQSRGKGVARSVIGQLKTITHGDLEPDLTFLFDLPVKVSIERLNNTRALDRFEKQDYEFHQRVREEYLKIANESKGRFYVIDSTKCINDIQDEITKILDIFVI
jgi:dTMP kinase|tara:strand:+ start:2660 stop:3274 length:615 start_codon:yes stop_codon:yes gene_type:complete